MIYAGKYPKRIRTIYSSKTERAMVCETNDGMRFRVVPTTAQGAKNPPRVNQDIREIGASCDHAIFGA